MTSNPAEVNRVSAADESTEIVRRAIEQEWRPLGLAVAALVRSVSRGQPRDLVSLRIEEVLSEAVLRAMAHPRNYEPGRPIIPWLVGIARNILKGEARDAATRPRRAEVDEVAWDRLVGILDPPDAATSDRMDIESMLSRLSPSARRAIEFRYWKGLKDAELAEALGVRTANAARVRVFRAVQKLKGLFDGEVTP